MIKLMIVDDEPIFREYLQTSFDFEAYGFEICCEARNGREALEMMEIYSPDVVLTDINMPHMDGLTLSERLMAINPDLGIVLITGHSEFEYAKKAVKIGVSDYILKPFEKEELMLTLLKLKDNIYESIEGDVPEKPERNLSQSLLMNLINQATSPSETIIAELKSAGLSLYSDRYIVTTLSIDQIDEKWDHQEDRMLWRFAVMNILDELMEGNTHHYSFYDYEGNIVSLTEIEDHKTGIDTSFIKKLTTLINNYLGFSVTVGIGRVHEGIGQIRLSYQESLNALSAKFLLGTNRSIHYDELQENNRDISFYDANTHEKIFHNLRKLDMLENEALLKDIFHKIHQRQLGMDYVRMIYMSLISILLSYIAQSGRNQSDILGNDFSPRDILSHNQQLQDWEQALLGLYKKTNAYFKSHEASRSAVVAKKACAYIDTHYSSNNLNVSKIAAAQFINQTYLRSMFKEEMGMTVIEYITKVRMNHARRMLEEGYYLLAEITEKVGYSDPSYFSKSFKKYFGMSPSQYEKQQQ